MKTKNKYNRTCHTLKEDYNINKILDKKKMQY